jgi:hypothetical protein
MRPKVLILVMAAAFVALALVFLIPRGGASGGSDPRQAVSEANADSSSESTESKIHPPSSDARRRTGSLSSSARSASPFAKSTSQDGTEDEKSEVQGANPSSAAAAEAAATATTSPEPKGSAPGLNAAQKWAQDLDEARHVAVETRVQELLDLGMEDDPKSLETIVSELSNADAEIRKAAVEATVQFGSQDAIPQLENAMLWAENAEQRKDIADAIEFLKLPRLTEVVAALPAGAAKKGK